MAKTKELVFNQPHARNYLPSAELFGIERMLFAKLLGVSLQDDLDFRKHIAYILHICRTLRPREHNFALPKLKYQSARNSFISRSLYKYV